MTTLNNKYSLVLQSCFFDAQYNSKHFPKEKNKWRLGMLVYNGRAYQGNDPDFNLGVNISVKLYHYGCGHSWTETPNGDVIDWAINYKLGVPQEEKCVWTKAELNDLGFQYHYYKYEDAIRKKTERNLAKCDKKKNPNEKCCCEYNMEFWKNDHINEKFIKNYCIKRIYKAPEPKSDV